MASRRGSGAARACAAISMLGMGCTDPAPLPSPPAAVEDGARITAAAGVTVPDEELVDQDGRAVRLRELFAGRAVAVNFVFTTCTTLCSPMTAIFARLARELGPAMESRVRLVSISLDPATDTPDKLRAYADRFERRAGWTFLTGPTDRVQRVRKALGGGSGPKEAHEAITLIGRADQQRWQQVRGLATADRLASWIRPLVTP